MTVIPQMPQRCCDSAVQTSAFVMKFTVMKIFPTMGVPMLLSCIGGSHSLYCSRRWQCYVVNGDENSIIPVLNAGINYSIEISFCIFDCLIYFSIQCAFSCRCELSHVLSLSIYIRAKFNPLALDHSIRVESPKSMFQPGLKTIAFSVLPVCSCDPFSVLTFFLMSHGDMMNSRFDRVHTSSWFIILADFVFVTVQWYRQDRTLQLRITRWHRNWQWWRKEHHSN